MANRRSTALLALVLSLVVPTTTVHLARADVTAADKETARTLMAQGRKLRTSGDHQGALESFKKADAIMNVPTTKLEVGREYDALGKLVEARDAYLSAARFPEQPKEPKAFTEARKEAERLADAIEPRIPSMKLAITGVPTGTTMTVTIDGETIPNETLDVPRRTDPGAHTIVVKAGSAEKNQDVDLKEGETKEIPFEFAPADFPATTTTTTTETKFTEDLPPAPEPAKVNHTLAWVAFGVGGAALVAGGITGLMSMSKTSSLKNDCPNNVCPPSKHDDLQSAKSLATISTISFIVAGVGATVGVIELLAHKPSSPEPAPTAASIQVYVGVGSAGIQGAF